jgi:uncharacterized protein YdaU (DUF1376 family)
MSKKQIPLWMPLYVEKFLADTSGLTLSQVGAYINLLCVMWRSQGGLLPNDDVILARCGRVERKRWWQVWPSIKSLFDVDGENVTSTHLQAELGKANARIVTKRALGSLGGQVTHFKRGRCRDPLTPPKPLKNNDGAQATAQANYNYNIKEEEDRSGSTRPETVEPSPEEGRQEGGTVVPLPKPATSENPISDQERQENLAKLDALRRQLKGGAT